jgi:hypothetical protein
MYYTRKNAQIVTNLLQTAMLFQQQCVRTACSQLVDKLSTCYKVVEHLSCTDLLQVVPTTCYRPAIQQFVNKL